MRSSIAGWIRQPLPQDNPVLTAAHLCAMIGHFEFYARTADERFRRKLMRHLILVDRLLAIAPPELEWRWQSLVVTRGLMVVAFFLPGFKYLRERALRRLETTILHQIYPDETVRQRSPDTQFQVVRELTEMSAILRMAQQPVSDIIMTSLTRLCPVLRAMRHEDGGAPPEAEFDQTAHNASFVFEMSYGRQRLLVNCGSSRLPSWQGALRHPLAHNSLVTENLLPFAGDGQAGPTSIERRILTDFVENDASLVLELKMEVTSGTGTYSWERRLSLSDDGRALKGEESVKADADRDLVYRFHLAPDIRISDFTEGNSCELECDGMIWQFTQRGATLSLEESVYFRNGFYQKTNQIVLTANDPFDRPDELPFYRLGDGRHRVVQWTLERL
ncbi:MAG: heparinase II/III family protein [Acetobacteraceae bacterium]